MSVENGTESAGAGRRDFLKAAGAGVAAGLVAPAVHAGGTDVLRIGLVGCGGRRRRAAPGARGSGAARAALSADANPRLVALGDLFPDRLQAAKSTLLGEFASRCD